MKITHISTYPKGGAANAAKRLHDGLLNQGVESHFLSLNAPAPNSSNAHFIQEFYPSYLHRNIYNQLGLPLTNSQKNEQLLKGLKGNYEAFTFPDTDYDIASHPSVQNADIINLHWIANFVDFKSFFKKVKKPIVWTLHDMNPFQGGFHYLEDRKNNEVIFGALEEKLRKKKLEAIRNHDNITVVAPSKWLVDESAKSETLGKYAHHHIPYSLNTDVFKPLNKTFGRSIFNLPNDKTVLLFVSETISNARKGFDLLKQAVQEIGNDEEFVLCAVGRKGNLEFDDRIISVGSISDERLMNILFTAADAFILPSREDNLPNVMLESLSAGTPVIAFPVGGMLDVIKPNENGLLAEEVSAEALKESIQSFLENKEVFQRETIRAKAISEFEESIQANRYIELYRKLL